jgi:hypothetical protein
MRGTSIVELLLAMGLILILVAIALPVIGRWQEESRVRGAAFHLAARCGWLRIATVHRHANVALRFTPIGERWVVQPFMDGDWDGVRSADIASGRDPAIGERLPVDALFPGATFGFAPGCPLVDGSPVPADANPVRIGSARMLVFSPDGTSSGGTLYLRGAPRASGYAVVVLGATGRTRLMRCAAGSGVWSTDAR